MHTRHTDCLSPVASFRLSGCILWYIIYNESTTELLTIFDRNTPVFRQVLVYFPRKARETFRKRPEETRSAFDRASPDAQLDRA